MVNQKSMSGLCWWQICLLMTFIKSLCTGRFPRPDELIDNTFQINGVRNYNNESWYKPITCSAKRQCMTHLDYEYSLEKLIWESTMVSDIRVFCRPYRERKLKIQICVQRWTFKTCSYRSKTASPSSSVTFLPCVGLLQRLYNKAFIALTIIKYSSTVDLSLNQNHFRILHLKKLLLQMVGWCSMMYFCFESVIHKPNQN